MQSLFVISVPLDDDWCFDMREIQTGEDEYSFECFEFKNEFEEAKYNHNVKSSDINFYIYLGGFILNVFLIYLIFHKLPQRINKNEEYRQLNENEIFEFIMMTFAIILIAPWVFSFLLPPPVEWFPDFFRTYNEVKTKEVIDLLKSKI
jgi:hypothetical protein